jgi:hypothetical protein
MLYQHIFLNSRIFLKSTLASFSIVTKLAEVAKDCVHSESITLKIVTVKLITSAKSRARSLKNAKRAKTYVLEYLDMIKSIDVEREIINVLLCVKNQIANIYVSMMPVMIPVNHMIVEINIHAVPNVKTNPV